mgnify:CR=1 FL=1
MSRVVVNEIQAKVGNDISFNDAAKIDTLKGKTTAGSITVQGEGTATTNLQQGLCKARGNIDGDASTPAFHSGSDNMNISSITDVATGRYTVTMTNNFANAFYQQANHAGYRDDANGQDYGMTLGTYAYGSKTTSENPLAMTYTNGSHYEADHGMFTFFGDLA